MGAPPVITRDAATVMLVRDTADGMEVFMLRRTLDADFVGGAYVFPGGAVDDDDRHADLEAICSGRSDGEASAVLGVPNGGLAFWVAAVRECFEEAGVLLARPGDGGNGAPAGAVVAFDDPDVAARFDLHRLAVHTGARRLIDVLRQESLEIVADQIHYFSHWITPVGAPKRYDTRFFVAAAPAGQVPLHDDHETIANLWVRPQDALIRQRSGELDMILPTMMNLEAIGRFQRSADLLAAAAAIARVPTVLPRVSGTGEGVRILLPGDAGYEDVVDEARIDPVAFTDAARAFPQDGRP